LNKPPLPSALWPKKLPEKSYVVLDSGSRCAII
jgi:hypothetical protein